MVTSIINGVKVVYIRTNFVFLSRKLFYATVIK